MPSVPRRPRVTEMSSAVFTWPPLIARSAAQGRRRTWHAVLPRGVSLPVGGCSKMTSHKQFCRILAEQRLRPILHHRMLRSLRQPRNRASMRQHPSWYVADVGAMSPEARRPGVLKGLAGGGSSFPQVPPKLLRHEAAAAHPSLTLMVPAITRVGPVSHLPRPPAMPGVLEAVFLRRLTLAAKAAVMEAQRHAAGRFRRRTPACAQSTILPAASAPIVQRSIALRVDWSCHLVRRRLLTLLRPATVPVRFPTRTLWSFSSVVAFAPESWRAMQFRAWLPLFRTKTRRRG